MTSFSDSELFSSFSPKERDRFEALSKLEEFDNSQPLLSSQSPGGRLSLIVTGAVDLVLPGRAAPLKVASLDAGDLLGELEPSEMPGGLTYVSNGGTITRAIEMNPLKHEVLEHRNLATQLLLTYCHAISKKLRKVNRVAIELIARHPEAAERLQSDHKAHLTDEEAAWLRMLGSSQQYEEGQVIIHEGDTSRSFFVVEQGRVEVRKQAHDGAKVLGRLGPNDLFGHMALIDSQPRSASVVASAPTRCTMIEPEALDHALTLNYTVAFKFLVTMRTVMGRLFRDTVELVAALSE